MICVTMLVQGERKKKEDFQAKLVAEEGKDICSLA